VTVDGIVATVEDVVVIADGSVVASEDCTVVVEASGGFAAVVVDSTDSFAELVPSKVALEKEQPWDGEQLEYRH